jgi:phage shock protein C
MAKDYGMESERSPGDSEQEGRADAMIEPSKRLRRSKNKMIAGVCAGLAEWLGWDVTLVRVLYVIISILSAAFPGTVVYLLLWVIMPGPDSP